MKKTKICDVDGSLLEDEITSSFEEDEVKIGNYSNEA